MISAARSVNEFCYILERVEESECEIIAVEHQASLVAVASLLGCIVGTLISEHTYMGHKAEIIGEVNRDGNRDSR